MAFQTVFKRRELKYMLTLDEKEKIIKAITPHMEPDKFGISTIRNLYYDTDTYLLVRRSIEKPKYKEKLRLRSYERASCDSTVFVELKKKFNHIVYKRRVSIPEGQAVNWLGGQGLSLPHTQITEEIDYCLHYYKTLRPTVFLAYSREAYFAKDAFDFRITFDDNILCRQNELSLNSEVYGTKLLPENKVLMEIKSAGGIPLWMTEVLSKYRIYSTSYSKYGTAYRDIIFPKLCKENLFNIKEAI